jgi:hypothetical protein
MYQGKWVYVGAPSGVFPPTHPTTGIGGWNPVEGTNGAAQVHT